MPSFRSPLKDDTTLFLYFLFCGYWTLLLYGLLSGKFSEPISGIWANNLQFFGNLILPPTFVAIIAVSIYVLWRDRKTPSGYTYITLAMFCVTFLSPILVM